MSGKAKGVGLGRSITAGAMAILLALAGGGCAWEVLDDLTYDGLIMFAVLRNDAGADSNPVATPIPSWFKDWYWRSKGRSKLYLQLKLSPETRVLARNYLMAAYERDLPIDAARSGHLLRDLAEAERSGVKAIRQAPCGEPFRCPSGEQAGGW